MDVQVRGILIMAMRDAFTGITAILGPERAGYFEEVEAAGWYDGNPYYEALRYLRDHTSPRALLLVGNRVVEELRAFLPGLNEATPKWLADEIGRLYHELVRGPASGDWRLEHYEPGRAILAEDSTLSNPVFGAGILRGALEMVGAYNVRVELLNERDAGSAFNRYLVEWIHPSGE